MTVADFQKLVNFVARRAALALGAGSKNGLEEGGASSGPRQEPLTFELADMDGATALIAEACP